MKKIVTFGEIMLRLAPPGLQRFTQARAFEATYGGGEANVAVSLANYGETVDFVTRLPKNDIGEACLQYLRQYGVGVDKIVRGGDRLGIYFLENGAVQLNLDLANLSDMLDRALAAASQTRPERRFEVWRDTASEAIFLRTDADRLVQVFINLISNARKYCDAEAPVLRISVRQKGGRVLVDFIDNGSGIPKQSQGMIFEKFSRLTDESRAGGAGLGLAICREIMANLGGTVSYLPGQRGAAFRVTVPLRLEKQAA